MTVKVTIAFPDGTKAEVEADESRVGPGATYHVAMNAHDFESSFREFVKRHPDAIAKFLAGVKR